MSVTAIETAVTGAFGFSTFGGSPACGWLLQWAVPPTLHFGADGIRNAYVNITLGQAGKCPMPTDKTDSQSRPWQFGPGNNANPAGRPKGSRNKLGEQFVADIYADWQKHGVATIELVREKKPDAYLKVVASLLPKELNVRVSELEDLADKELDDHLFDLVQAVGPALGLVAQAATRTGARGKAKTH